MTIYFEDDWSGDMKGNRAVLYLRLSKEDVDKVKKGDDSASIVNQRLLLTDYALAKQFQIVNVYSDDDESGLYDNRPEFERMMFDAKMDAFDIIIAKTQSRFSRNMEHIEKYLHHDLPNLGIRFIGVVDGVDTDNEDNKKSRQINGLVNEWYCEDLSKNIKSALRAKMKAGQFLGSSCPYGYRKDPDDHNHLVVDEYAANVVKRIYQLYLSGYGKAKIGAMLSSDGILIPTLYKRQVLGENYYNCRSLDTTKNWSYQTIHTILNNETYIGNLVQNKANTISYKDKKKKLLPKEKWIVVKHTHEPIIEPEIFDRVQKLQKARIRSVDAGEENSIFAGMIYCADCKHAMVRKYARRGNRAFTGYQCKTYKTYGKQFCDSHSIDMQSLKDAVLFSLKEQAREILSLEDVEELNERITQYETQDDTNIRMADLQKKMDKIKSFKKKTYHNYLEEVISREDYLRYIREYDDQINELQIRQTAMQKKAEQQQSTPDPWAENFADFMNVTELTRDMVLELIHRMEVHADGSVTVWCQFHNSGAE